MTTSFLCLKFFNVFLTPIFTTLWSKLQPFRIICSSLKVPCSVVCAFIHAILIFLNAFLYLYTFYIKTLRHHLSPKLSLLPLLQVKCQVKIHTFPIPHYIAQHAIACFLQVYLFSRLESSLRVETVFKSSQGF